MAYQTPMYNAPENNKTYNILLVILGFITILIPIVLWILDKYLV